MISRCSSRQRIAASNEASGPSVLQPSQLESKGHHSYKLEGCSLKKSANKKASKQSQTLHELQLHAKMLPLLPHGTPHGSIAHAFQSESNGVEVGPVRKQCEKVPPCQAH